MSKSDIINSVIKHNNYKSYLEIGLAKGVNFKQIRCDRKMGADPVGLNMDGEIYALTSDEFFAQFDECIDFIFIDGLHLREQVIRDVKNSLKTLSDNGTIMVHDCNPRSYEQQLRTKNPKQWCGDVWKAWVELRRRTDIHQVCIREYFGCGIITKGTQKPLIIDDMTYDGLEKNRETWLNLVSWNDYEKSR